MAFYNQNYQAIPLNAGSTYTQAQLGDGYTAATIHEVFCLSGGSITISALGGGTFTWTASTSDSMDILVGSCTVNSGMFVGFKSKNSWFPLGKF